MCLSILFYYPTLLFTVLFMIWLYFYISFCRYFLINKHIILVLYTTNYPDCIAYWAFISSFISSFIPCTRMKPTTVSTATSHNHISHPSLPSPITPPSDAPPLVPPQLPHPTGSRHLTPDPAPAVRVRGAAWPMCTGELPASATVAPPHTATRCRAGRPLLPRGSRVMGMLVVLRSGRGGGVYLCHGGGVQLGDGGWWWRSGMG